MTRRRVNKYEEQFGRSLAGGKKGDRSTVGEEGECIFERHPPSGATNSKRRNNAWQAFSGGF